MSSISPDSCPPDVPFWVRIPGVDGDVVGLRVDPGYKLQWSVATPRIMSDNWYSDSEVTVLRPVGEQLPDWEILRQAANLYVNRLGVTRSYESDLFHGVADRWEAEYKAEQVKAAQDAKLEELIEGAARVMYASENEHASIFATPKPFMDAARALADAGYLRVVCDGDGS